MLHGNKYDILILDEYEEGILDDLIYCPECGHCGDDMCCGDEGNGYKAKCVEGPLCLYPKYYKQKEGA